MVDFGALPPEVNSARMHFGLGSETLVASAAAWTALAAELGSAGQAFQAVTMTLAGGPWTGPSAVTMAAAAAPYVAWVMAEAALCGERGVAATNAAMAFETARAGHIHPTIVASNRAELAALVASNFLGVNTPAIAANEAQYAEFWAQDAAAMYGYAGAASAITGSIIPDLPAMTTTNPAGLAAQAAEVGVDAGQSAGQASSTVGDTMGQMGGMGSGLSSVMSAPSSLLSAAPQALQALASPLSAMMGGMGGGMFQPFGGASRLPTLPTGIGGGGSSVIASMGRGLQVPSVAGAQDGSGATRLTRLSVPSTWAGAVEREAKVSTVGTAIAEEENVPVGAAGAPRGAMIPPSMGGSSSSSKTGMDSKKLLPRMRVKVAANLL